MTLILRLVRLFKADVHEVLERLEEPVLLLKQALRDMQEIMERGEQRQGELRREHAQLKHRRDEHLQQLQRMREQLGLCLSENNDQLARAAVKRKLEIERRLRDLDGLLRRAHLEGEQLSVTLVEQKKQIDEVRDNLDNLLHEQQAQRLPRPNDADFDAATIGDDEIDLALLQAKRAANMPVEKESL